jgi:hypothetical protein
MVRKDLRALMEPRRTTSELFHRFAVERCLSERPRDSGVFGHLPLQGDFQRR